MLNDHDGLNDSVNLYFSPMLCMVRSRLNNSPVNADQYLRNIHPR
jgi:hypothetical protein